MKEFLAQLDGTELSILIARIDLGRLKKRLARDFLTKRELKAANKFREKKRYLLVLAFSMQ